MQFAKTADTVGVGSESDAWFSETAINRFVAIEFDSTALPDGRLAGHPVHVVMELPLRYYTREDGEQ